MVSQRNDIQMLKRWNLGNMTKLLPKKQEGSGENEDPKDGLWSFAHALIGASDLPKNAQWLYSQ